MRRTLRPSTLPPWPAPFDAAAELDWGQPEYARRLLSEHLDQSHDGASRRKTVIAQHVRRLKRLLPQRRPGSSTPVAGLASTRWRWRGSVITLPVSMSAARRCATRASWCATRGRRGRRTSCAPTCATSTSLRPRSTRHSSCTSSSRRSRARRNPRCLRASRQSLEPDGVLIAEMRVRPQQPPGRLDWWDVVPNSLLSDRRHVLLGDSVYDPRKHTYVLRDVAVFDDGTVAVRQTSGWLCPFGSIPRLFNAPASRRWRSTTAGPARRARRCPRASWWSRAGEVLRRRRRDGVSGYHCPPSVRESCLEFIHDADAHT